MLETDKRNLISKLLFHAFKKERKEKRKKKIEKLFFSALYQSLYAKVLRDIINFSQTLSKWNNEFIQK